MGPQAWLVLGGTVAALLVLASNRGTPALVLGLLVLGLGLGGVVSGRDLVQAVGNEGLLTVAVLLVVAAGLERSGLIERLVGRLLGPVRGERAALLRLTVPVAALSGFLNNTPLVAMLIAPVSAWARRNGLHPGRLLLPLSYATILGGTLTIMGTSTNLVVNGLLKQAGREPLGFFAITPAGLTACVAGLLLLMLLAPRLLPRRGQDLGDAVSARRRAFTGAWRVVDGGPLDGRTLADADLGGAHGLHPVELRRDGLVLAAPGVGERLRGGDVLVFAGPTAAVLALHTLPGLEPTAGAQPAGGEALELVVLPSCPLVGSVVGDGSFRARYGAAVLAVSRAGEPVGGHDTHAWTLQAGDLLLVEAGPGAATRLRDADTLVVIDGPPPPHRPRRGALAIGALAFAVLVLPAALGWCSLLESGVAAVLLLAASRILDRRSLRRAVDAELLATIACGLVLGTALERSGVATAAASLCHQAAGGQPWLALAVVYGVTLLITEIVTNNAAAAVMIPVALGIADHLGLPSAPFAIAVAVAASCGFATPIGYATNLMVMGPGGYRFSDYLRLGLPLDAGVGVAVVAVLAWGC
jgi:di/tricarboxylate transporter